MTKNVHGNDIYAMLIDIIIGLSPLQAERLYAEILPKYTKRAKTKLYNEKGELDDKGYVRLLPMQYQTLRTKFGDTYIKKAFTEITNYIKFLERNIDYKNYKSKLKDYTTKTHNILLTEGWVYDKCKKYICTERPKININPFLINDLVTAREYIKGIPVELRNSMDVQALLLKFPQLADEDFTGGQDDGQ